jgi:hypothetical protein
MSMQLHVPSTPAVRSDWLPVATECVKVLLNFSSGAGYTSTGQNVLNSKPWLAD